MTQKLLKIMFLPLILNRMSLARHGRYITAIAGIYIYI
ncbi:MAG: hypothetical protein ACI8RD_005951, partial [Bacillariaceae sp.]